MESAKRPSARMTGKLLQTKLMPPRLPAAVTPRRDLFARLNEGLTRKLTLVTAPTGFGKTTLVASWAAAGDFACAWVSLDAGDNAPARFWAYVAAALRGVDPALGKDALAALLTAQPISLQTILTPLINELTGLAGETVLVLEDYQCIQASEVQQSLAFFLHNLPPLLHVLVISRSAPDLPLGILRARGDLVELDADSLRFSRAETDAFLRVATGTDVDPNLAGQLYEHTEGWAAGLRLIAQALPAGSAAADLNLHALPGPRRSIADYLIEEVFARQPEAVQNFLLQTCFLSRLTGSLCDAVASRDAVTSGDAVASGDTVTSGDAVVSGDAVASGDLAALADSPLPGDYGVQSAVGQSAALLEQLVRADLFLFQLQGPVEPAWYRYHALFAESIQALARRRLGDAGVRAVFERASAWYAAHGQTEEAVEMALKAGRYAAALVLMERYVDVHGLDSAQMLRHWVEQAPEETLAPRPKSCLIAAQVILYTSDRYAPATAARIEPLLRRAEAAWQAGGRSADLGQLHAFAGVVAWWQGALAQAYALGRQAFAEAAESDVASRGTSLLMIGYEALSAGRVLDAQDAALEARALLGAAQNEYGVLAAAQLLGECLYNQGELEQADAIHQEAALTARQTPENLSLLDDLGDALLGLANTAYERNDLDLAESNAAQALDLARQRGNPLLHLQAGQRLAAIQAARGDLDGARAHVMALSGALTQPVWLREVRCALAEIALLAQDRPVLERWQREIEAGVLPLADARQAMERGPAAGVDTAVAATTAWLLREREALTLARLYLALGQSQAARVALDGWAEDAAWQGRSRSQVTALCLLALAQAQAGEPAQATETLSEALQIGQNKGLRRLFIDLGPDLAVLLQAVQPALANRSLSLYVTTLLYGFAPRQAGADGAARPGGAVAPGEAAAHVAAAAAAREMYFEPLSRQEIRVLRLLIAGLSNGEIAQELVVSRNTVKTQVQSIFRKLNVNSRDEAGQVAKALNLV